MKDLQIAITDYYASKNTQADPTITMRPSVETLPETGNQEGDVRFQENENTYYVFDNGVWNKLEIGSDMSGDVEFATDDELMEMLKQGEEEANG